VVVKADFRRWLARVLACGAITAGCGADAPPGTTGGTSIVPGPCGRGVVVVGSDYATTNVSFVGFDGAVLSASVVSSGATTTGLSSPFSGDVVLPTMPAQGDRIVLIDRYPASVLTWVDVATGQVASQLAVRTGFFANPQDYVPVSPSRAYVSRYGSNPNPGSAMFDEGNDLVVVDPSVPSIEARVDLRSAMAGEAASFLPSAGRAIRAGGLVHAVLDGFSADFQSAAAARVATLDAESGEILGVKVLDGVYNCRGVALSPDGSEIALSCSGMLEPPRIEQSWLVFLTADKALSQVARYPAAQFGNQPLGFTVSYASATTVLFTSLGTFPDDSPGDDRLIELDRKTGAHRAVLQSARSSSCGQSERCPFTIGDVACAAACGVCFVADAVTDGGVIHRFSVGADGHVSDPTSIVVERAIGLPPRYLQLF
jgi:hypothetical protein